MIIKGIQISDCLQTIIDSIESKSQKPIQIREIPGGPDVGMCQWMNTIPTILLSRETTCEEVIAHEILHLELRIHGFPDHFTPEDPFVGKIENFLQHHVIYPKYLKMGYSSSLFFGLGEKGEMKSFIDELERGGFDLEKDKELLYVKFHASFVFSDFHGLDDQEKSLVQGMISPFTGSKFRRNVTRIAKNATIGPQQFSEAVKNLSKLFGAGFVPQPVYIGFPG
jgi:hypothetical protein